MRRLSVLPCARLSRRLPGVSAVAVLAWLVTTTLSLLLVRAVDLNPLTSRGALMPLAVGGIVAVVLLGLYARWPSDRLAGVAAGCFASWTALVLFASFHGTPFGDSGLRGDTARLTAAVTRYTVTLKPVDAFVPSLPAEYPPLFPWLIARAGVLLGRPGWTLVGDAEALAISLGVLGGFLLWRRLVAAPVAVILAFVPPFVFGQPRKAYEIAVLSLFTPWALGTLSRFRQLGGLHWLPAGVLLGLFLQTYQGYLLFDALGLAMLAFVGLRVVETRGPYLRHLVATGVTAFVVAGWYLVPYLHGLVTIGGSRVNDAYVAGEITGDPLGMLVFVGSDTAVFRALGFVGLVALRRRCWWARPILLMLGGAYAYRLIYLLVFVVSGHTGYLDYTSRLMGTLLLSSCVLTIATVVPLLARRLPAARLSGAGLAAAALVLVVTMHTDWTLWMPTPVGRADARVHPLGAASAASNLATYAHAEPLPDGHLPRYAAPGVGAASVPVDTIAAFVRAHPEVGARPRTLSYTEKLFAYVPWRAYVAVERGASSTFSFFDDRVASLSALAAITDPVTFASASRHLPYGPIDVFVLHDEGAGWMWAGTAFLPSQFDRASWDVLRLNGVVVAVRRA